MRYMIVLGLLALSCSAFADAGAPPQDSRADVFLTVEKYCTVTCLENVYITLSNGVTSGSNTAPWNATANFDAVVTATNNLVTDLDPVTGDDISWTVDIDGSDVDGDAAETFSFDAGVTGDQTLTVYVDGWDLNEGNQVSTKMGTVTLTLTEQP